MNIIKIKRELNYNAIKKLLILKKKYYFTLVNISTTFFAKFSILTFGSADIKRRI